MTPDHRCVTECSGRYKKGEGRTCVCEATGSGACPEDCPDGYIRAWVYGDCVLRAECPRIYLVDDKEVCLSQDICDDDQYLSDDGKLCEEDCEVWSRHPATGKKWCVTDCGSIPSDWPKTPYSLPDGECVSRCPVGYYKAPGSHACGTIPQAQRDTFCVSVFEQEYRFLAWEARSYSSVT